MTSAFFCQNVSYQSYHLSNRVLSVLRNFLISLLGFHVLLHQSNRIAYKSWKETFLDYDLSALLEIGGQVPKYIRSSYQNSQIVSVFD